MLFLPRLVGFAKGSPRLSRAAGWVEQGASTRTADAQHGIDVQSTLGSEPVAATLCGEDGVSAWNLNEKLERRRQAHLLDVSEREKASAEDLNSDANAVVTKLMDSSVQQQTRQSACIWGAKWRHGYIPPVLRVPAHVSGWQEPAVFPYTGNLALQNWSWAFDLLSPAGRRRQRPFSIRASCNW
jgi:hypothetical protein